MAYIGNNPDSVLQGRKATYTFTATAGQTVFSGIDDNGNTLDLLQAESNDVYLNGSRLIDVSDFTVSGDVLTLTSAAAVNDIMVISTQQEFSHSGTYTKAETDSRYINYDGDIVNGSIQMGGGPGNNITFADNNKIVMGTGNDLEIYHSGTNSYIDDVGEGSLFLRSGTTYIQNAAGTKTSILTNAGAGQTLYHNNTPVFVTTSTGIDVTGNVVASGTVDGRDIATDGTKLDTVETNADVTDATNVAAAGALMTTGGTITGKTSTNELELLAIAKDISDTAVDVFIYDTRKDSDGGAWRKRTQHTSWYNETLNTATRGSRKEFPAVAVIVLEAGGSTEGTSVDFTIYDGDDPDMPMWMQYRFIIGSGSNTGIAALNGIITFGCTDNGVLISDFVKDRMRLHNHVHRHTYGSIAPGRLGRSTVADVLEASVTGYSIVSQVINDVAMTVLPNAPIDSATGLPVPTIAVATSGGVSVIKDDGTVANMQRGSNETGTIAFDDNYDLIFSWGTSANAHRHITRLLAPWISFNNSSFFTNNYLYSSAAGGSTAGVVKVGNSGRHFGIDYDSTGGGNTDDRLLTIAPLNTSDTQMDMTNFITSTYNTGWMNGDIKLATLSDTDDTNVTGAELVTNGTMESNSGWGALGVPVSQNQSNAIAHSGTYSWKFVTSSNYQGIKSASDMSVVSGKTYVINSWVYPVNDTGIAVRFGGVLQVVTGLTQGAWNEVTVTVTATSTSSTSYVQFDTNINFGSGTWYIDDVSVRLAEEDRSVNGNGVQVFGTVTKTAVATGAELMGYSGFSTSNYLRQPYNSDLNPGTGAVTTMGWYKTANTNGSYRTIVYANTVRPSGGNIGSGHEGWQILINPTNQIYYYVYGPSTDAAVTHSPTTNDGNWHFFCAVTSVNNNHSLYVDGVLAGTNTSTVGNLDNSLRNIEIGAYGGTGNDDTAQAFPFSDGSLCNIRVSRTAPSPAQIKKIYEDEKFLFQENAKATLYGSSDAVTALAYDDDTELLHVGTSAGRSVFQGLRRIDNTTDAVGAAISASNGMVAED